MDRTPVEEESAAPERTEVLDPPVEDLQDTDVSADADAQPVCKLYMFVSIVYAV